MSAVGVVVETRAHRVAIAELPSSARRSDARDGAVAMIDGRDEWWIRAARARDAGAAAIVVTEPGAAPAEEVRALAVATAIPVVVQRARLRRPAIDVLRARLDGPPVALVAEGIATPRDAPLVLRDAAGWMRELTGVPVAFASHARTSDGVSAAGSAGGAAASILLTASPSRAPLLDLVSVAPARAEVRLDEAAGRQRLAVAGAEGTWTAPPVLESPEREALRAAIDAVRGGGARSDLHALAVDAEAVAALSL